MRTSILHSWDIGPRSAQALQKELASQLVEEPYDPARLRTVAGVDVSVRDGMSQAAIVILSYPAMQCIETVRAQQPTRYPYVPGLLTFREGPVVLAAWEQLQTEPDVVMFDGMGRIHPRRMGIAAHLGLWLDKPTLGIGKTHYIGDFDPPPPEKGAWSWLRDKDEIIGAVVRTRTGVKPVYVSAGHRMNLLNAIDLTLALTTRYRLPEPIRQAHQAAGRH